MAEQDIRDRLVKLYQEIADLTMPKCDSCLLPNHCCDPMYCRESQDFAKRRWDVELKPTSHLTLPMLSPETSRCTVAPHLRPICAVHACCIDKWGADPKDPAWSERYWELRDEINDLEWELEEFKPIMGGEHDR